MLTPPSCCIDYTPKLYTQTAFEAEQAIFYILSDPCYKRSVDSAQRRETMKMFVTSVLLAFVLMFPIIGTSRGSRSSSHHSKGIRTNSAACCSRSSSDRHVTGYTKRNGKHVQGYNRTAPNGTQKDNFSTEGNVNPYTGKKGTKKAKH